MLTLPIKKKWFDMILSGEKKEEYREIKEYYNARFSSVFGLMEKNGELIKAGRTEREKIQKILFRNGYGKDKPVILADCELRVGTGKKEWGAESGKVYYILSIKNICAATQKEAR